MVAVLPSPVGPMASRGVSPSSSVPTKDASVGATSESQSCWKSVFSPTAKGGSCVLEAAK